MPRPPKPVPSYRLHKSSGQAVVTLPLSGGRRKDVLLGPYNSPESKAEYARVIQEWEASGRRAAPTAGGPHADLTVNELLVAFLRHADRYYVHPDGRPTSEARNMRDALRPVKQLYGHTPAAEFGPLALKAVRRSLVEAGLCRGVVNKMVGRVKRVFKWAASEELVPVATYQALATVAGLPRGRGDARETEPVRPADPYDVAATLPYLTPAPAAMVGLQLLTGMRPGEW